MELSKRRKKNLSKYGSSYTDFDPVLEQSRKESKKSHIKVESSNVTDAVKILPKLSIRLGLHKVAQITPSKYSPPKSKKKRQESKERREKLEREMNFCRPNVIHLPERHDDVNRIDFKLRAPSAEIKEARVIPRKPSTTPSDIYPDPPTKESLDLSKIKSGVLLNISGYQNKSKSKKIVRKLRKRRPKKHFPSDSLQVQHDSAFSDDTGQFSYQVGHELDQQLTTIDEMGEEAMYGEGESEGVDLDAFLTKQYRKKVAQLSKTTSYRTADITRLLKMEETGEKGEAEEEDVDEKIIQKFKRDSDIERYELPPKIKIKRGTFKSHSFTKLEQTTLGSFYFGVKLGTIHQGDNHFMESSRNNQGICMSIAAYCRALLKHPNKWTEDDIDEILEDGTKLYEQSCDALHLHSNRRELEPDEVLKLCQVDDKSIRFEIVGPEVAGFVRSDDKRVYNLTKALRIFFQQFKECAAILQMSGRSLLIWRDRYFYIYDAQPRTLDLFISKIGGVASLANLYNLDAVLTVLLDRSDLENPEFRVYALRTYKMGQPGLILNEKIDEKDVFKILDGTKAVLNGSFDLSDRCFGYVRGKQSLTISLIALIYSKISAPSAWHRLSIDKIMIIGNQLYLECIKEGECGERAITVDDLPGVFTVGPYLVELKIDKKRIVDLIQKKGQNTLLSGLEKFFETNNNCLVQIDQNGVFGVWRQRNVFHLFDPYPRNSEGLYHRGGSACLSMHATLESLSNMINANLDVKDAIYFIHAVRLIKIHRDPTQGIKFPKNMSMNQYNAESFKNASMKRCSRSATSSKHPVSADMTTKATVNRNDLDDDGSLIEVGSTVKSLNMEQLPPMVEKTPPIRQITKNIPDYEDFIVDLDSPSLSDTQIEPPFVQDSEEISKSQMDLTTNFDLTQEELELLGKGESGDDNQGEEQAENALAEGGEEDWYYTKFHATQVGSQSFGSYRSRLSMECNTEFQDFKFPTEILPIDRSLYQVKKRRRHSTTESWKADALSLEPDITISQELAKDSNFIDLPDNSQIVSGTKSILNYDMDLELGAPFVSVMAAVVAKKYAMISWSKEIIDYVLERGSELYNASEVRFDEVVHLEIPRLSLGSDDFAVNVNYILDAVLRHQTVEGTLNRALATATEGIVFVTPTYSCFVLKKNHLYYLFDCFENTEIGLASKQGGTAFLGRFKSIHDLVTRILYNKKRHEDYEYVEYNRFVISRVKVKRIAKKTSLEIESKQALADQYEEDQTVEVGEDGVPLFTEKKKKTRRKPISEPIEPQNKIGFQFVDGTNRIEGSNRPEDTPIAFYVCLCACLMAMKYPVKIWDTRRMNKVVESGKLMAELMAKSESVYDFKKRKFQGIVLDDYEFDVIAKRVDFNGWKENQSLRAGIEAMIAKKCAYFLICFERNSFVVNVVADSYHLFDGMNSTWYQWNNLKQLEKKLRHVRNYKFFTLEIAYITKASRETQISNRSKRYRVRPNKKLETLGTPFYEKIHWLNVEPIPWSLRAQRERPSWNEWRVEFENDLYSLYGGFGQYSDRFEEKFRGKQTLANLVVAIGMVHIYDLDQWSKAVIGSILENGDRYFHECVEKITELNHELEIEDLASEFIISPYKMSVNYEGVINGTIFLERLKQFNLFKALRYFFEDKESRFGVILVNKSNKKRQVAFGKTKNSEYFMFDCEIVGAPIFIESFNVAYALRTTSFNRLLHVMTLTLRGGDFYIYEVDVVEIETA